MSATDIEPTQDFLRHIDSALEAGSDEADRLTKRRFWNGIETKYWDWPNFQRAYPWRIWFDASELADVTVVPPAVTSGGISIPDSAIFWGPANYSPPFTWLELDRSQSYSFGAGVTPQRSVAVTGNFGYWARTRPAGALAAALSDSTSTAVTVTSSSPTGAGVGDVITCGTEAMLVSDQAMADTGQTQTGAGVASDSSADKVLTVGASGQLLPGEILQLDSEQMLALSVSGATVTVQRAYGGTVLAEHSNAAVYAARLLTVHRGFGGTTATSHLDGAAVTAALVPGMVRELTIAESLNYIFQKTSGYARTIGENGASTVPGGSLPDLRARVTERYGRKARTRVI